MIKKTSNVRRMPKERKKRKLLEMKRTMKESGDEENDIAKRFELSSFIALSTPSEP